MENVEGEKVVWVAGRTEKALKEVILQRSDAIKDLQEEYKDPDNSRQKMKYIHDETVNKEETEKKEKDSEGFINAQARSAYDELVAAVKEYNPLLKITETRVLRAFIGTQKYNKYIPQNKQTLLLGLFFGCVLQSDAQVFTTKTISVADEQTIDSVGLLEMKRKIGVPGSESSLKRNLDKTKYHLNRIQSNHVLAA